MKKCVNNNKKVYLSGWYSWVNRESLSKDFEVLDHIFYEKSFNSSLKEPSENYPNFDLININDIPLVNNKKRATIRTIRGCPNKCVMCPVNIVYKSSTYFFPLEYVKKQIHLLYDKGFREINFLDDNFCVNKERTKELLRYLISCKKTTLKGMSYLFHEGMEVNSALDLELCMLLKASGFKDIKLGVESLNNDTLKAIGKPYKDKDLAIQAIENLNKADIKPTCFILFGLPNETEESYRYLIETLKTYKVKVRSQLLYKYTENNLKSEISEIRLREIMDELMTVTGSNIWKRK